jgi:hypothetical protein
MPCRVYHLTTGDVMTVGRRDRGVRREAATGTGPPGWRARTLLPFAVACLWLSWGPWLVLALLGVDVNRGAAQLVFAVAACGPSLAALVAWLMTGRPAEASGAVRVE